MATDITLYLADDPGELGRLGKALGVRDVNIEGICAVSGGGGQAEVHILVEDPAGAFAALAEGGFEVVADQEVAIVEVEDRPGMIGEVSMLLGNAGVNIGLVYLATRTRLVVGADNLARARDALG